jgi:large subunit ribosomal protein L9
VIADRRNVRMLEHQQRVATVRLERQRRAGEKLARELAQVTLTVSARAGQEGRLFGSVTNMDVERLLRDRGFAVERRRILLEEPIKAVGTYTVSIQVSRDLQTAITVIVDAEAGATPPEAAGD